jgi:hypothetical protein
MATKKPRKPAMSAEEKAASDTLAKFVKANEGKTLSDKQKEEKKKLQEHLGKLKFVRIANKRVPRAMTAIKGIGNLAGKQYVKTEAQIKAICDALDAECKAVRAALLGTKESKGGFSLPGFEDAKPQ